MEPASVTEMITVQLNFIHKEHVTETALMIFITRSLKKQQPSYEADRWADRQTDRQTDRQAGKQADRQTDRQTGIPAGVDYHHKLVPLGAVSHCQLDLPERRRTTPTGGGGRQVDQREISVE